LAEAESQIDHKSLVNHIYMKYIIKFISLSNQRSPAEHVFKALSRGIPHTPSCWSLIYNDSPQMDYSSNGESANSRITGENDHAGAY
jgi:hypothetical protein